MKKDRINPKIKLTTRRTPITAESITYEQLELLPPKASVLVLKEYAFLLEAKWNELGQNNIQISRALERCRKINQMEKKRTIAQESLYFFNVRRRCQDFNFIHSLYSF